MPKRILSKKIIKEVLQMVADFDPKDEFWNEFVNHPEIGYLENRAIDSLKDVRTVARIIDEKRKTEIINDFSFYEKNFKMAIRLAVISYIRRKEAENASLQT